MKTASFIVALALGMSTLTALGQDAGGPPPGGGPGHKPGGFHVMPPRAMEQLNLTEDQMKQIEALEAEVKARMEKILTADQLKQLKEMRPPRPEGKGKTERPE